MIAGEFPLFPTAQALITVFMAESHPLRLSVTAPAACDKGAAFPSCKNMTLFMLLCIFGIGIILSPMGLHFLSVLSLPVFRVVFPPLPASGIILCFLFLSVFPIPIHCSFPVMRGFFRVLFSFVPVLLHTRPTPAKITIRVSLVFVELLYRPFRQALATNLTRQFAIIAHSFTPIAKAFSGLVMPLSKRHVRYPEKASITLFYHHIRTIQTA